MREIAPGLWHWTARHERIGIEVSAYYLEHERVLIDPMVPAEGLAWFERRAVPEHALLSNRHHDRHAWRFKEEFGLSVHCVASGVHEIERRGEVVPFEFGEELPGGVIAHEVDVICPDETALHIRAHRALACADGAVRFGPDAPLGFVPDQYMDEPERTKSGLREAYRQLLALDFDTLLLAHGEPIVRGGKEALRAFAEGG